MTTKSLFISSVLLIVFIMGAWFSFAPPSRKPNTWDHALVAGNNALDRSDFEKASEAYTESLRAAQDIWGVSSYQASVSLIKLGLVEARQQHFEQAEPYLRQGWEAADAALKESDRRKWYALGTYAGILEQLYKFDEATPLYERGLKILEATSNPLPRDIAQAKLSLATNYRNTAKIDAPVSALMITEALEASQKELDAPARSRFDQTVRADALVAIVNSLIRLGEFEASLPVSRRVVELSRQVYGEQHIRTAESWHQLGVIQIELHTFENAERSLKAAISALSNEKYKSDLRGRIFIELAWLEQDRRRLPEAVEYAEVAADQISGQFGKDDPRTGNCFRILALLTMQNGQFEKAAQLADYALSLTLRQVDNSTRDLVGSASVFTLSHLVLGRPRDVSARLRQISATAFLKPGRLNLYSRISLLYEFAGFARHIGDEELARSFLKEALKITPQDSVGFIDVALESARVERSAEHFDAAIGFALQGLAAAERLAPRKMRHLTALRVVGNTYLFSKRYVESSQTFAKAYDMLISTPGLKENDFMKAQLLAEMANLYQETGEEEKLYGTLKLYRLIHLKSRQQHISNYAPRLIRLMELARKQNDTKFAGELNIEVQELKAVAKLLSNVASEVLSALSEELERQRKGARADTKLGVLA